MCQNIIGHNNIILSQKQWKKQQFLFCLTLVTYSGHTGWDCFWTVLIKFIQWFSRYFTNRQSVDSTDNTSVLGRGIAQCAVLDTLIDTRHEQIKGVDWFCCLPSESQKQPSLQHMAGSSREKVYLDRNNSFTQTHHCHNKRNLLSEWHMFKKPPKSINHKYSPLN